MTHASLFSGIGGPEVAAAMLGWTNAFHCEINPFGRAVLEYWFPNSVSYEDITKTDFKPWRGRIDVLTGGFPCQPFSYAGQRRGQDDDRYLWPQMLRAIDEIRPAWVVGENVAGITTMVEGGVLADLGGSPTLFQEGDELHEYELEQPFTIERICRDLEQHGYSVQPMLIPAAAVGAPHRRDRIFILAADADTKGRNVLRTAGEDAGAGRTERLSERDEVRESGVADNIRSAIRRADTDTLRERCEREGIREIQRGRHTIAGDRAESEISGPSSDSVSGGCPTQEPCGRITGCRFHGDVLAAERGLKAERPDGLSTIQRDASDTDLQRFDEREHPAQSGETERLDRETDSDWRDSDGMRPGCRWAGFPSVSPVHRGNDGLPFDVDDLAFPQTRWRFESLKAYGNAIVPQVMYQIFKTIEQCQ